MKATADANYASLGFIKETTWGETPTTPRFSAIRFTGEKLTAEKDTIQSQEIREDRNVADLVKVGIQASGGFNFELSYGAFTDFLSAALFASPVVLALTGISADIDADAQTLDGLAGDFDDVPIGATVKISGATNPLNNGLKLVVDRSGDGSLLTFAAGSFVGDQTGATVGISGNHYRNGITRDSFTLERKLKTNDGKDYFQQFIGMVVDGLTLKFESKQIVTGELMFLGARPDSSIDSLDAVVTGTRASRVLTATANFSADETVTIGSKTYTFKATPSAANHIDIGVDLATSLANLAAAINGGAGEGTAYGTGTVAHTVVTATSNATTLTVTAIEPGVNTTATTDTAVDASWAGATLTGGVDPGRYDAAPTEAVLNATNNVGTFLYNRVTSAEVLKSIELKIANGLRGKDAMGTEGNFDIGVGTFELTGSFSGYFQNNDLFEAFRTHTPIALSWRATDAEGNTMVFSIHRLQTGKADPFAGGRNQDVMIDCDFTAIYDPVTGCAFSIDMHPAS